MRKLDVVAILFLVLSLARLEKARAASSALPPFDPVNLMGGKAPGKNVKNWIMLTTLTPSTIPPPVLLISPTTIHVELPQQLIRLSRAQYDAFDRYTRTYRCQQTSWEGDYRPTQALAVREHANGKTQVLCRMLLPTACRYLTGARAVHGIGGREQKWEPLRNLSVYIHCK